MIDVLEAARRDKIARTQRERAQTARRSARCAQMLALLAPTVRRLADEGDDLCAYVALRFPELLDGPEYALPARPAG
jgi:hypothetical protein